MKPGFYIYIALFMFASVVSAFSAGYKFEFAGHNYEVVMQKATYANAVSAAKNAGGHLVFINSQDENDTVFSAIINGAKVPNNYTASGDGGGTAYVWIGGTDQFNEGTWVWYDPTEETKDTFWTGQGANGNNDGKIVGDHFINWGGKKDKTINEPDDFDNVQDCASIALNSWPLGDPYPLGRASEWNDLDPTNQLYYVIEYETKTDVTPETAGDELRIYPNPADNYLHVGFSGSGSAIESARLVSTGGEVIMQKYTISGNELIFDISYLACGTYFVVVTLGDRTETKSLFVKQ